MAVPSGCRLRTARKTRAVRNAAYVTSAAGAGIEPAVRGSVYRRCRVPAGASLRLPEGAPAVRLPARPRHRPSLAGSSTERRPHAPLRPRHHRFRIRKLADHPLLGRQTGGPHRRRRLRRHLPECRAASPPRCSSTRPGLAAAPAEASRLGVDLTPGQGAVERHPRPDLRPDRRHLRERPAVPGRGAGQR